MTDSPPGSSTDVSTPAGSTLDILSAGAAQGLAGTLSRDAGVRLAGHFGAVGAMRERFLAGDPCDLLVLTHAQVAELMSQGLVVPGSAADLGTVKTSVAVRAGDPVPDVSSPDALRAALRAADAIYYPDPQRATAGIHFAKVVAALGLADELAPRLRPRPNGMTSMRELSEAGGRPIGCTQTTEIVATPGVMLAGPLPKEHELATVYTVALPARSVRRDAAVAFAQRLAGDAQRGVRQAAGYEGATVRPAQPGDGPGIRAVVREVLQEFGLKRPGRVDADLDDVMASYGARGGAFDVVVGSDGLLVGCAGVVPLEGGDGCELRKMYLLRTVRGQGLGRRLLDRAIAFARGSGHARIELETASALEEAIALYQRTGFEPVVRAAATPSCDRAMVLPLR